MVVREPLRLWAGIPLIHRGFSRRGRAKLATRRPPPNKPLNRAWNSAVQTTAVPFSRQPSLTRRSPAALYHTPVNADPLGGGNRDELGRDRSNR